jgi:hypothetical protein
MAVNVEKVSVALGSKELAWVRERAEREGSNVSAVLTEAARAYRLAEDARTRREAAWSKFLRWATKGRGVSAAALEAARRELDGE